MKRQPAVFATFVGLVVALSTTTSALAAPTAMPRGQAAPAAPTAIRTGCLGPPDSIAIADDLLLNRYTFSGHRTVTLPADPTWRENPLRDNNWRFQFHTLRFVLALFRAWSETGDARYVDRATFLLADWYRDNPRSTPPSPYSWNDHSTAWRAMVYACAHELLPARTWLTNALLLHGRTLADPDFYVGSGNHALNQAIGLLEVGCRVRRTDWMSLAGRRMNGLVARSVDAEGVTNEQAVFYQLYNYQRYGYAERRLRECGQPVGWAFARVDKMPRLLAHATLPNGTYAMLGDTTLTTAKVLRSTPAEFPATRGASGWKPGTWAVFSAGFGFARTGWGESRPWIDETMLTVRFGPGRRFHGHHDGSSITLYGYGTPLLVDAGQYSYTPSTFRTWFVGRSAHNVVVVDGASRTTSGTALRWKRVSSSMFELAMSARPYVGVTANRRVTFSRGLGYVVVDDRMTSTTTRTFRQLWHLREGSAPIVDGTRTWTRRERGNLLIVQVIAPRATRVVTGTTSPIQGWLSYRYGEKVAAPVVEARRYGTSARFLTLLVPYASVRPAVRVSGLRLTSSGYTMTVTIDGRSERLIMGATGSTITPLG